MTHPIPHNTLFAWYDGQLQDLDRQEVEQHVAHCSECQRTYARWQQTERRCFPPPRTEVSDTFVDRLMTRIERLERRPYPNPWSHAIRWLVPSFGLACLALAMPAIIQHPLSTATLLLADGHTNHLTDFVLASEPPTSDEAFDFLMEGFQ